MPHRPVRTVPAPRARTACQLRNRPASRHRAAAAPVCVLCDYRVAERWIKPVRAAAPPESRCRCPATFSDASVRAGDLVGEPPRQPVGQRTTVRTRAARTAGWRAATQALRAPHTRQWPVARTRSGGGVDRHLRLMCASMFGEISSFTAFVGEHKPSRCPSRRCRRWVRWMQLPPAAVPARPTSADPVPARRARRPVAQTLPRLSGAASQRHGGLRRARSPLVLHR
jgi:hypothetical protein